MKYIDAEKLKEEIEKRRKFHDDAVVKFCNNRTIALTHSAGLKEDEELLSFLDTLSEEPDKSLEEAAEEYIKDGRYLPEAFVVRPAFIAGAEWMEKEINKELIKAMEKVHEIRDVDYDIHIDTSTNGSFNRLNIIQNEK